MHLYKRTQQSVLQRRYVRKFEKKPHAKVCFICGVQAASNNALTSRIQASIGIGENQLLARVATRTAKPGGSFHLKKEAAIEHIAPLPLSILPGFGRSALEKIKAKWGITTCGEAREIKDIGAMQKLLGARTGAKLWNFVRGIDDRELRPDEDRKTVSATINVRLFVFLAIPN